jgi:hypothetical protein
MQYHSFDYRSGDHYEYPQSSQIFRNTPQHCLSLAFRLNGLKVIKSKSLLVRGPEGKMVDLEVLSVGFK